MPQSPEDILEVHVKGSTAGVNEFFRSFTGGDLPRQPSGPGLEEFVQQIALACASDFSSRRRTVPLAVTLSATSIPDAENPFGDSSFTFEFQAKDPRTEDVRLSIAGEGQWPIRVELGEPAEPADEQAVPPPAPRTPEEMRDLLNILRASDEDPPTPTEESS